MVEKCSATNANGSACGSQAQGNGLCRWHDPVRAAEMVEARRKGGQAKSNKVRARKAMVDGALSPAELEGLLGITMSAVLNGHKEPAIGNAIANLARAAVAVRDAVAVDERISELERRLGSRAS